MFVELSQLTCMHVAITLSSTCTQPIVHMGPDLQVCLSAVTHAWCTEQETDETRRRLGIVLRMFSKVDAAK